MASSKSQVVLEYAPGDAPESVHLKLSMKIPSKWLQPERGTKVERILSAFAKSYNAKFGDGKLEVEALGLLDPTTRKTIGPDDTVVDLMDTKAEAFNVIVPKKVSSVTAPPPKVVKREPVVKAPPPAAAPPAAADETDAKAKVPTFDGRNTTGTYRKVCREFQTDQPTVAAHVTKPKTKIYRYHVIAEKGTPYHAGPFDESSLGDTPPRATKGTVFEGLCDEKSPGRIRVIREKTGTYDGYWICRIYEGHEGVERVGDGAPLASGRPYVPPAPYKKPAPEPAKEPAMDPATKAAWDNYMKHGLDGGGEPSAAEKEWRANQTTTQDEKADPLERARARAEKRAANGKGPAAWEEDDEARE